MDDISKALKKEVQDEEPDNHVHCTRHSKKLKTFKKTEDIF